MSNIFNSLLNKIKVKKTLNNLEINDEYAFSLEEIDSLREENNVKIKKLKEDKLGLKKKEEVVVTNIENNSISGLEEEIISEEDIVEDEKSYDVDDELSASEVNVIEEILEESLEIDENEILEGKEGVSFVNLSKENQDFIMKSWNDIDNNEIDKDIINGKDILNHNYNITYGDNALKYVHDIRKKYETVICYLIGFNNEKNGIENKTIFSDRLDDEWKYLGNYIKLLEKIRNFKK